MIAQTATARNRGQLPHEVRRIGPAKVRERQPLVTIKRGSGDFCVCYLPPATGGTEARGRSVVDEKAVLAVLAVIVVVVLELTVGWSAIGHRCVSALRQVRVIPAAESVVLMGIAVGMSFVIVFMLGPALGEALRFAGR
jgi:hypothetical protein